MLLWFHTAQSSWEQEDVNEQACLQHLVRIKSARASVNAHNFHDGRTLFWVWQRVETLTATGCFCLNKNHTLSRMVITLHEIVKNHFDFDYSHISFSIWWDISRDEGGSEIYRMMSKISSPSRLRANRLLPQWLREKRWKVAVTFAVMFTGKSDSASECFLKKKKKKERKDKKKMCCTGATGVSDMAAHLFGELDEKAQSLWFPDMSDLCVFACVFCAAVVLFIKTSGLIWIVETGESWQFVAG